MPICIKPFVRNAVCCWISELLGCVEPVARRMAACIAEVCILRILIYRRGEKIWIGLSAAAASLDLCSLASRSDSVTYVHREERVLEYRKKL